MSMTVRTNIASMQASGQLNRTQKNLSSTLGRISSGLRITQAADDAAGLGVATSLETDVISTKQAMRNANDGISIIQTAESATNEVTDILQRMRELAVQSASETLANEERSYIQDEFVELRSEVARIAAVTEFNGVQLTDGTTTSLDVQVGIDNNTASRITIQLGDLTTTTLNLASVALQTVTGARGALDIIDTALGSVNQTRSRLGATVNRLEASINATHAYGIALTMASSRLTDADYAKETSEFTKFQILMVAGGASMVHHKPS